MREDSCIGCLFSVDTTTTMMLGDLPGHHSETMKCSHPNSPYYEELVFEDYSCRLYVDSKSYFKMKDRRDNIEKIKENIRKKGL